MDSLLKIASAERFLARLVIDDDQWVLNGGLNLLARLGPAARLTRGADLATGIARSDVETRIRAAADRDLGDFLSFQVRAPVALDADGEAGGLRFRVDCDLADRDVATFNLDVVLTQPAPSEVDTVELPGLTAFAELPLVTMRALVPARQIVEKLHAYTRDHGAQVNGRPRDLVDMLALAAAVSFTIAELRRSGSAVFAERAGRSWPPAIQAPPPGWGLYWDREGRGRHGLPDVDRAGAFGLLGRFWSPVLDGSMVGSWDPAEWRWSR